MNTGLSTTNDLEELARFFRALFPDDPTACNPDVLAWRYRAHVADPGFRGIHLVWRSGGAIVGHLGTLPVTIDYPGGSVDAAWIVDWHVLASYRGRSGGMRLLQEAVPRYPLTMGLGLSVSSASICRRSGWQDAGLVRRRVAICDPIAIVSKKVGLRSTLRTPPRLARFFAGATETSDRAVHFRVEDVPPPGAAWLARHGSVECIRVRRDPRYVNARFGQRPPWPCFHLIARRGDEVVGWAAVVLMRRRDGIRTGVLLETIAATDDIGRDLRAESVCLLIAEGAERISIPERNVIDRGGVGIPVRGARLIWRWNRPDPPPGILHDSRRWYISGADSDQER